MSEDSEQGIDWFELEICPFKLRLAIIPRQPFLFGYTPASGRGQTYLVPEGERLPEVSALGQQLWQLCEQAPSIQPSRADPAPFSADLVAAPSVHIRAARGSERFEFYSPLDRVPDDVSALCERARVLALELVSNGEAREISGREALAAVKGQRRSRYGVLAAILIGIVGVLLYLLR